jgi:hypothetical protein
MVASAGSDHSRLLLVITESGKAGVGAANLERTGPLEVLALQADRTTNQLCERT